MTDFHRAATPSVVVFETDSDNRNMYTLFLESLGAAVRPVATAADALACFENGSSPDALVFDVVRSEMTVAAFCTALRRVAGPRRPRLILVTGWLLSADERATLASLEVDIHQKPCSLDTLWAKLRA